MKSLISVTTMVRDSGPILDEFLERLSKQRTRLPHELVVLYYGEGKDTLRRLRRFSPKIIEISSEEFDLGISRDLVCKNTSGNYVVTVSIDALPTSNLWLQELVTPIISGKADIVQGNLICPKYGDIYYPNFFYWERNYTFFYTSEAKRFFKQYGNIGLSCVNMAFRKEVWDKGGFNGVSFCEDKIFQKRAYSAGYTSTFNKKAATLHAHSYASIESLFNRISNEGFGWSQVGEIYGLRLMLKDLFRIDLHGSALKALFKGKLRFFSEILFFLIRPVALYWGNHYAKSVY